MRLARLFASWVEESGQFELMAPVPFSVVCFRWRPPAAQTDDEVDGANEQLLETVNKTGEIFVSHTRLNNKFVIRLAVGNLHTTEVHVRRAWDLVCARANSAPLR
jgi:aromatic-L-amino-acid decarboxylase